MILALYALGGFVVGVLTTGLVLAWLIRREERQAFRDYWGPP